MIKLGYSQDMMGLSTGLYEIINKTIDGKYIVRKITEHFRPDGTSFKSTSGLIIKSKVVEVKLCWKLKILSG